MRIVCLITFLLIIVSACQHPPKGRNGVVYKNAVEYNDYIISRQNNVIKKIIEFSKLSGTGLDSANELLDNYARETAKLIVELQGMPPYKKDSVFRDAAISNFKFYKKVFEGDYKELLALRKRDDLDMEELQKELDAITERITIEEEKLDKQFHKAQSGFAKDNNIKLTENSLTKELEKLDQ
jgi:hypothetical protein